MGVEIRVHAKFAARIDRARLVRIARRTLRAERADAALTIYVTTDAEIRVLNRKFHAMNAATDVLSFPARSAPRSEAQWRKRNGTPRRSVPDYELYIGDIVVS